MGQREIKKKRKRKRKVRDRENDITTDRTGSSVFFSLTGSHEAGPLKPGGLIMEILHRGVTPGEAHFQFMFNLLGLMFYTVIPRSFVH